MKMKLISWTMATALAALIAVPALASPNPKPAQAAPHAGQGKGEAAKHPRLHEAMRSLEVAKKHLEAAPHDFGGHRTKAIEHINAALEECRAALEYAKEHKE
jgi:hypothetical protein